jgi:hypothetical protein
VIDHEVREMVAFDEEGLLAVKLANEAGPRNRSVLRAAGQALGGGLSIASSAR